MSEETEYKTAVIYASGDPHLPESHQIRNSNYPEDYFDIFSAEMEKIKPEVFLLAGDLCWYGEFHVAEKELERLSGLPAGRIYFVEGEYDPWSEFDIVYENNVKKMQELFSDPKFYYIGGRADIFTLSSGVKVGIAGARGYLIMHKNYSNKEFEELVIHKEIVEKALADLAEKTEKNPTDINIMLLHYPPSTIVMRGGATEEYDILKTIVDSNLIDYIICAHIHENPKLKGFVHRKTLDIYTVPMEYNGYKPNRLELTAPRPRKHK